MELLVKDLEVRSIALKRQYELAAERQLRPRLHELSSLPPASGASFALQPPALPLPPTASPPCSPLPPPASPLPQQESDYSGGCCDAECDYSGGCCDVATDDSWCADDGHGVNFLRHYLLDVDLEEDLHVLR